MLNVAIKYTGHVFYTDTHLLASFLKEYLLYSSIRLLSAITILPSHVLVCIDNLASVVITGG
jgi:hypothetical protein